MMSRIYRLPYSAVVASALHLCALVTLPAAEMIEEITAEGDIWSVLSTIQVNNPEHLMQQLPSMIELRELVSSARSISEFLEEDPTELNQ